MNSYPRLAIIGGGASGMAAAIALANQNCWVTLFERQSRLGKKLLATGNGRCNFSHKGFNVLNYHGTHPHFVREALERYDEQNTLTFFEQLGLKITIDTRARYYPHSLQGSAVLDVLRLAIDEAVNIKVCCDSRITKITAAKDGTFILKHSKGTVEVDAVIVATGGEAAPKLGGTTDGYHLLESMGHQMIKTAPGIVQLVCDHGALKIANGLKREMQLTVLSDGHVVARDQGEVLITNYGLSGPPVLQCAGHAVRALGKGKKVTACLNFFPDMNNETLFEYFQERHQQHPSRKLEQMFVGLLPRLFAQAALKVCGFKGSDNVDNKKLKALAQQLTAWSFCIKEPRTFAEAQVTLGGIDTADFDSATMQSWIVPGVFACGEVLDIDGDCGGYNLQWAWSSGRLAAESALAYLQQA